MKVAENSWVLSGDGWDQVVRRLDCRSHLLATALSGVGVTKGKPFRTWDEAGLWEEGALSWLLLQVL